MPRIYDEIKNIEQKPNRHDNILICPKNRKSKKNRTYRRAFVPHQQRLHNNLRLRC